MRALTIIWRWTQRTMVAALWLLETVVLGALALARLAQLYRQTRIAIRRELACPARHVFPAFGRTQCASCGALRDGWLLGECPVCRERPAYIRCPVCTLAVVNPLR